MRGHEPGSERRRTEAFPPTMTEAEAFRAHDRITEDFSEALRTGRCRRTRRYHELLGETVGVLAPLMGPWNLEILFRLYMAGPTRFLALKRGLGDVSSRVLTDKLRQLAQTGFVGRHEEGAAVRYALTPTGEVVARHLHPVVFYLHNQADLPR